MEYSYNRLIVLGSKGLVRSFRKSRWEKILGAKYCELLENSPKRYICQYETDLPPFETLRKLSRQFPKLQLMLDWESVSHGAKGLLQAKGGQLALYRMEY
jgi:hypothetical protein